MFFIINNTTGFTQDEPAYGEINAIEEYKDPELRTGHLNLGPVDSLMNGYFNFKEDLTKYTGLYYSIEYAPIFQFNFQGNSEPTWNDELNLIGQWSVLDHDDSKKGNLLVWYQISSTLGELITTDFMNNLGVISPLNGGDTYPYRSASRLQNFSLERYFFDERLRVLAGKLTTRIFLNLNRYAVSDREDFFSPMFVNNTVVPFTARLGVGGVIQYINDDYYITGMMRDADADDVFMDFQSLDNGNWEYAGEFGFTPDSFLKLGKGIYRFTYYYTDATGEGTTSQPAGWTTSFSFDQDMGKKTGAFLRYAYSDKQYRSLKQRLSTGVQFLTPLNFKFDRIGFGAWWSDPYDNSLQDEFGIETFWKIQFTRITELSADMQVVINPVFSTTTNFALVGGLRFRIIL